MAKPRQLPPLPTGSVEQHYRVGELAELLGVSVDFVSSLVTTGSVSRGKDGLWPAYALSPRVTVVPASAVAMYLRRRAF